MHLVAAKAETVEQAFHFVLCHFDEFVTHCSCRIELTRMYLEVRNDRTALVGCSHDYSFSWFRPDILLDRRAFCVLSFCGYNHAHSHDVQSRNTRAANLLDWNPIKI